MATYLDWKNQNLSLEIVPHKRFKTQLTIKIKAEAPEILDTFCDALKGVYLELEGDGGELRLELPHRWDLFWKLRESGSRALLAHPESEQWVGTLALDGDFGRRLLSALKNLRNGESLKLSTLGSLEYMSNLEIEFCLG